MSVTPTCIGFDIVDTLRRELPSMLDELGEERNKLLLAVPWLSLVATAREAEEPETHFLLKIWISDPSSHPRLLILATDGQSVWTDELNEWQLRNTINRALDESQSEALSMRSGPEQTRLRNALAELQEAASPLNDNFRVEYRWNRPDLCLSLFTLSLRFEVVLDQISPTEALPILLHHLLLPLGGYANALETALSESKPLEACVEQAANKKRRLGTEGALQSIFSDRSTLTRLQRWSTTYHQLDEWPPLAKTKRRSHSSKPTSSGRGRLLLQEPEEMGERAEWETQKPLAKRPRLSAGPNGTGRPERSEQEGPKDAATAELGVDSETEDEDDAAIQEPRGDSPVHTSRPMDAEEESNTAPPPSRQPAAAPPEGHSDTEDEGTGRIRSPTLGADEPKPDKRAKQPTPPPRHYRIPEAPSHPPKRASPPIAKKKTAKPALAPLSSPVVEKKKLSKEEEAQAEAERRALAAQAAAAAKPKPKARGIGRKKGF